MGWCSTKKSLLTGTVANFTSTDYRPKEEKTAVNLLLFLHYHTVILVQVTVHLRL